MVRAQADPAQKEIETTLMMIWIMLWIVVVVTTVVLLLLALDVNPKP